MDSTIGNTSSFNRDQEHTGEMPFYQALLLARKSRGMTQDKLSKLLGVDRSTIGNWETGTYAPNNEKKKTLFGIFPELAKTNASPEVQVQSNDTRGKARVNHGLVHTPKPAVFGANTFASRTHGMDEGMSLGYRIDPEYGPVYSSIPWPKENEGRVRKYVELNLDVVNEVIEHLHPDQRPLNKRNLHRITLAFLSPKYKHTGPGFEFDSSPQKYCVDAQHRAYAAKSALEIARERGFSLKIIVPFDFNYPGIEFPRDRGLARSGTSTLAMELGLPESTAKRVSEIANIIYMAVNDVFLYPGQSEIVGIYNMYKEQFRWSVDQYRSSGKMTAPIAAAFILFAKVNKAAATSVADSFYKREGMYGQPVHALIRAVDKCGKSQSERMQAFYLTLAACRAEMEGRSATRLAASKDVFQWLTEKATKSTTRKK